MKILSAITGVILLALAVSFALSNRQTTTLGLWPFDIAVDAPLYVLALGTLLAGLLVGAGMAWLSLLPHRAAARRLQTDIAALHDKIDRLTAATVGGGYRLRGEKTEPLHRRLLARFRRTDP